MIPNNNLNVLPMYTSVNRQHHRRRYTYGQFFPLYCQRSRLLPFQIIRYNNVEATIQEVLMFRMENGDVTDITASILANGLEVTAVLNITNYDIIKYYPTAAFSYDTPEGRYYVKINDGENTWYSEVFVIKHHLNDMMKITWWHHENFVHSGAYIKYIKDAPEQPDEPFKNFMYLPYEIGKPTYESEEKVKKIDGVNMPLHQVSWKQYRFSMFATEQLLDAMRVIWMHSFVKIEQFGETYSVDEFKVSPPEWLERGDIAEVDIEFTTDTVIVTNGGELTQDEYYDSLGHCLDIEYICVALISEDSPEYAGFYYAPLSGGGTVDMVDGDLVLIKNAVDEIRLYLYSASSYGSISPGGNAYVINKNRYFFPSSGLMVEPEINTVSETGGQWYVTGQTFSGSTVTIYGITSEGLEYWLGEGTEADFEGAGVEILNPESVAEIQARISSNNCINFAQSKWVELEGVGWQIIESTNVIG